MYFKKAALFLLFVFMVVIVGGLLISCTPGKDIDEEDAKDNEGAVDERYGGILKVAIAASPPSLDVHRRYDTTVQNIGSHIFEYLFDYNSNYEPQPALAESYTMSEDGLTFTIKLRENVLFHNGKNMTAEDVVASIERYFSVYPVTTALGLYTESIKAVGDYTVEYRLKAPYANFLSMLTSGPIGIMPKEICEEFFEAPNDELPTEKVIGTGPYKLKAHESDRYVYLERFEDYVGREEEPDGFSGARFAYADEIHFYILPDSSVRFMGVESGEYHFARVDYEEYNRIKDNPEIDALIIKPSNLLGVLPQCSQGPTANLKVRQAIYAALDMEPILQAVYFYPEFYEMHGCNMSIHTPWYTEASFEHYNQAAPEKARQLLEEAGYNGEPIVMIGVGDYEYLRNLGLVVAEQLEAIGLNIDLQLVEAGTFMARLANPEMWHLAVSEAGFAPSMGLYNLKSEDIGKWLGEDPEKKKALEVRILSEMDHDTRFKLWEEFQTLIHEEASSIRIGEGYGLAAVSANTGGWKPMHAVRYYNVYFK